MTDDPIEAEADALVDGLDVEATARLLNVLKAGQTGGAALADRARQKLLLHRVANALDRGAPQARTERLADRLTASLAGAARRRRIGWAAAIVLAALGLGGLSYSMAREQRAFYGFETARSRVLIEAGGGRDVDLGRPGSSTLAAQLTRWVGRPVHVPDLTGSGFRLIGAKLLKVGGVQVVGLVYDGREGEMMLCLSRDLDGMREAPEIIEADGLQAGYWSDGEKTYALLRDRGHKGTQQLVAQLSRMTDRLGAKHPPKLPARPGNKAPSRT